MKKIKNIIWLLIISGIFIAIGFGLFYFVQKEVDKNFEAEIDWNANISMAALDSEHVAQVSELLPDKISELANSMDYQMIAGPVLAMGTLFKSKGIKSIYVLSEKDGKVYFISESTPIGEPLYVAPGTVYKQPPLEAFAALNAEYSPLVRYKDEFGNNISKFTPIVSAMTNKPVGVLGIDVDNNYYQAQLIKTKIIFWAVWSFIYFIFIILSMYFRSLSKIKNVSKLNEQKIVSISNAINDGLVVVNSNTEIAYWNKACENIFGFSWDKALGSKFSELVKITEAIEVKTDKVITNFEFSLGNYSQNNVLEVKLVDSHEIEKYYELSINTILINKEKYLAGVFHDISSRKEEEDKLQNQKDELERLNNLMTGRELKMIELKKTISELTGKV